MVVRLRLHSNGQSSVGFLRLHPVSTSSLTREAELIMRTLSPILNSFRAGDAGTTVPNEPASLVFPGEDTLSIRGMR